MPSPQPPPDPLPPAPTPDAGGPYSVRPARDDAGELTLLGVIEGRAGVLFVDAGMPEIASDDVPSVEELRGAAAILVAVDRADRPVGYARIEVVDGHAHLEQLSVDPAVGRRGIGTSLLDAVSAWAAERGQDQVTLTTFRDVAFNAPYYRARGFDVVAPANRGPELAALVRAEAAHGLDPSIRVTMVRPVPPGRREPGGRTLAR